jgi:hypothetical protein
MNIGALLTFTFVLGIIFILLHYFNNSPPPIIQVKYIPRTLSMEIEDTNKITNEVYEDMLSQPIKLR